MLNGKKEVEVGKVILIVAVPFNFTVKPRWGKKKVKFHAGKCRFQLKI